MTGRVIHVDIHGQRYAVRSDLDPQYIGELAEFLDAKMRAAASELASADPLRIAVIAALNISDELFRARADSAGRREDAALWYAEAARVDSSSATGRRALLRYASARLAQGDTLAAALAFQVVASGGTADSTGQAASARLTSLGVPSSAGDSARTGDQ